MAKLLYVSYVDLDIQCIKKYSKVEMAVSSFVTSVSFIFEYFNEVILISKHYK